MTLPKVTLARARAHWHARSGLARPLSGSPDDVIARTGWLRTLGGVDVYLAARARVPGLSRAALDAQVEQDRLRVIPAVRGCIYLVPAAHAPLALAVAEEAWRKSTDRELAKAGTSWQEVEEVGRAVVAALAKTPMKTDQIRKVVTVRSLGDAGKKVGLSSPLPVALRALEFAGSIERTLEGGRLDTERYVWRATSADAGWDAPSVPATSLERWAELARIFASCAGPVTVADFASWAGLAQRDARAAVTAAQLAPIAVESYAEEAWVIAPEVAALAQAAAPSDAVALLSFEDNYLVARGGPRWVVDPKHWGVDIQPWGTQKGGTLGDVAHILTRTFTVGDEVAGMWEMDPDAGEVVWAPFAPIGRAATAALDKLADETAAFLKEMGHAHSFTLDTDESVRERAAAVKKMKPAAVKKTKPAAKPKKKAAAAKPKKKAAKK
jgi:hypothetical protein